MLLEWLNNIYLSYINIYNLAAEKVYQQRQQSQQWLKIWITIRLEIYYSWLVISNPICCAVLVLTASRRYRPVIFTQFFFLLFLIFSFTTPPCKLYWHNIHNPINVYNHKIIINSLWNWFTFTLLTGITNTEQVIR